MLLKKIAVIVFLLFVTIGFSQKKAEMKANMVNTAAYMIEVGPLAGKELIPAKSKKGAVNPRRTGANKIIPGKGFPRGMDPLLSRQKNAQSKRAGKAPSLTFEANSRSVSPSDPTGAIGPSHYVSAKNSAFAIHDRNGNVLIPSSSLENIFPGESLGDPIVFYDSFVDRFVITQFSNSPDGFLVAVCKGPDPVNDGWFTYRFNTGSFPDYTKFSIWSDGYYVTANKDQGSQDSSNVVFVIERDKMLIGEEEENVKIIGFPLPGSRISGFYSPASFNALGNTLPPDGDARIIYFQDDEWEGVDKDILKLWKIDVNWISPSESTIVEAEEIEVTPFDSTFDGGFFGNLPQPGIGGDDIDVLQGAVMYATNYRRFCDYNSVLLNFAVDIDPVNDNIAAIRWYELRQNGDGQPWTVFQEGTYTSSEGKSAWCGSMAMDIFGNIGMGYTTMGTTANGATGDSFASIRYTGRLASDPLGAMTVTEQTIAVGTDIDRTTMQRYGDYAQLTVDPTDDQTFWHIAEYFENTGLNARNIVGVFKIANDVPVDVGVISIDVPEDDAVFSDSETITVTIKNFGSTAASDIPVNYAVNGVTVANELLAGPIGPGKQVSFTFATTTDLSSGELFEITAETNLAADSKPENDCSLKRVKNILGADVGVGELVSPLSGSDLSIEPESITITLFNFGNTPQSNIPVFYILDDGEKVNEVFTGTIAPQQEVTYTFETLANIIGTGKFKFEIGTMLANDQETENDSIERIVVRDLCRPIANCRQFGDGVTFFELSNVKNEITCNTGYEDFTGDFVINLNRSLGAFTLTVQSGFADDQESERISLWIDFNDNMVFEESEQLIDNAIIQEANTNQDFTISINNQVPLGKHLLRIRGGDVTNNAKAPLNDPCGSMDLGTTHDYTVEIGENKELEAGLVVISESGNQFLITRTDLGTETEKRIFIFNILGQLIASNLVVKDANSRFIYTLDMSYAKSGVYFVRFGEDRKSEAKKFIVR